MGLFSDYGEDTVFKNEDVLQTEYLPEKLPHREGQVQAIANAIKPAISGKSPYNLFILGSPGVGKTAVVKHVFNQLSEYERVIPIYINCWEYNTRHAVLSKILNELGGIAPRRGIATDEVYERFESQIKKSNQIPIIALDEIDQLLLRDGSLLLYDLLRCGAKLGLIAISNDPFIGRMLDDRVKSSIAHEEIHFKPYTKAEVLEIVKDRMRLGFRAGKIEEGVAKAVAEFTDSKGGDIRLALECLWKCGRTADQKGTTAKAEYLNEIFKKASDTYLTDLLKSLSETEKAILKVIAASPELSSGELLAQYGEKNKIAERTMRNYVSRLETLKLIDAPMTSKGYRGKSRIISLRIPKDLVLELP